MYCGRGNKMINYNAFWPLIKRRANERSTWIGLTLILTAFGISLNPEQIEAIALAGLALGGLLQVLLPEPAGRMDEKVEEVRKLTRTHL